MTTTRLPKTITAGALLATPIPPVKWIIPGLLPAGLAIFAGPSKAGKSWLTLWLCLQISQGKSVWGREIEPRTVLYFSLEDPLGRLQERLYKLVDAEEDPERLILQTESHGIGQGLEEQIVSFIHTYPDISLIVIDTLQKVRKSDQNGSMYANDYKDIGALKELADKYGICILKANNLPLDLNVHSLRHTNASLLIAQGVDVRTVASLLGHAQASTTLDIYAHAFDKNKRKAQEKLGKAIGL